jgi:hypothetical protein
MKTHASEGSAVSPCAQTKMDVLMEYIPFRIAVFTLSVAGGYYFTRWVCSVVHQLPFWTNVAHDKAKPAADALRTLHSGFGD